MSVERRDAAMRANYSTTANLEARQSLLTYATGMEGTHAHDLLDEIPDGTKILDVGCGTGTWLTRVAAHGPSFGMDLAWPMLQGARTQISLPLVNGDAQHLPIRAHSVDVVLMLWMLYHVPDKATALREVGRVLTPGGHLLAASNAPQERGHHVDIIRQALSDVLGRPVQDWLEPLDFNADNGADILSDHFSDVQRHDWEVHFEVPTPEPLLVYLSSGRDPIEAEVGADLPWDDILTRTSEITAAHIIDKGALRFTRTGATFSASTSPTRATAMSSDRSKPPEGRR